MIDERTEAQASLYALGALPPEEAREFETLLHGDLQLQLLVKDLQSAAGAMVAAFPRVAPPPDLKLRILDALEGRGVARHTLAPPESAREGSWMFWVPWILAACFASLCVLLISLGHSLRRQTLSLSQQLEETRIDAHSLREQLAEMEERSSQQLTNYQSRINDIQKQVLQRVEAINRQTAALTNELHQQQADTRRQLVHYREQAERLGREKKALEEALSQMTVGDKDRFSNSRLTVLRPTPDGVPGVIGASVWNASEQRGLLVLEGLPPPPPNRTYQFWLIDPRLTIPISGGVLPPEKGASLRIQFTPQIRVENAERFAISIEPAGGSPTPTGKVVLSSR